jgi:hypothetical protein
MAEVGRAEYGPPKRPARDGEFCCCGEPASVVFLTEDLGPVPFCGFSDDDHSPPDCPPWCAQDHGFPYDRRHMDAGHMIPLDAFPERSPLLVGLAKDLNKPACIEIVGVDDQLAGCLTAYEADRLAGILRILAVALRKESQTGVRR